MPPETTDPRPEATTLDEKATAKAVAKNGPKAQAKPAGAPSGQDGAGKAPPGETDDVETDDDVPRPPPGYRLTHRDLDGIAEIITGPQIDRLVKLRSRLDRRDEYRAKGISPRTHIVMLGAAIVMGKGGKRLELDAGKAVAIEQLDEETHAWLLEKGHAERPE